MRLLVLFLVLLTGCGGNTRIGFISNHGGTSVNGTVSIVHLSVIDDANGTSVTVTAVTLIGSGTASNLTFCGDLRNQFPMNQPVTAIFNPGTTCATLISVRSP